MEVWKLIFLFSWVLLGSMLNFRGVHTQTWTSICLFGGWEKKTCSPPYGRFFFEIFHGTKLNQHLKQIQVESDQDDLKTWDEFENMG